MSEPHLSEPHEAIEATTRAEADELFLCAVMLARLCSDPVARAQPLHQRLHLGYGIDGHAGPALVAATQRSLGISDERARLLVDSLEAEARMSEGLVGPSIMAGQLAEGG
jgi:hypothetical protein